LEEVASVAVEVDAGLEPLIVDEDTSVSFSPGFRGITPSAVVRDADGIVHHLSGPRLAVGLGPQTVEIPMSVELGADELRLHEPAELLGVALEVELPEGALGIGEITLERLQAGTEAIAIDQVEPFAADADNALAGFGPAQTTRLDFALAASASGNDAVPVLASTGFLAATGAAVGDQVELGQLTERRQFAIVGSVRAFPTVDPGEPFVIADLASLSAVDEARGDPLEIDEWWLRTSEGSAPEVASTLRADPYSAADVMARDELHRDLLGDPVALGVIGALALGALSAIVFAAIGFVVSATVSTRERLGEFALLQAIGLSHRQLATWLSMENAFLLFVGLLAGTGLGLVLAWVVLPFVTLTQEATLAVPPVEVVFPWGIYGLLYLVALGGLGATVIVIGRLLARVRVSGVLRSGGE
ncbi:MAG: FtsX-like permease family protein, partial [Actinomycetota bacterium]|nr:FtsX-like permease family protein [Actinomycetota bacterium]